MHTVGFVGCENQSHRHATVVAEADDAEIVGCADIDLDQTTAFADEYDIPDAFRSFEEMADAKSLEAVIIEAVPMAHPDLVESAIEHGIEPVLSEKPMVVPGEADPVVPLSDSVSNYELADALLRSTETDRVEPVAG